MTSGPLKLLLTAVGCPGGVTMIRALKKNGEREIEIIGTDMRPEAAGRFLVDRFYTVPAGTAHDFIPRLLEIIEHERPDILLPQSSYEVYPIAVHKSAFEERGVKTIVSKPSAIALSNDKGLMYAELKDSGVPCPQQITCNDLTSFTRAVRSLGYPDEPVCFKPTISKGSRGFRILSVVADRVDMLINRRVDETTMTLQEAIDILKEAVSFPSLVISELVEGKEFTVDVFCQDGRVLMGFVKTREAIRAGLAMYFEIVDRPDLRLFSEEIVRRIGLDFFANIQFKGDRLLEINPRVSTFIHQGDFNMPYLGLKFALGEADEADLRAAEQRVRQTRRSVRYYDQIFYDVPEL